MLATISALPITLSLSIHGIPEVVQGGGGREGGRGGDGNEVPWVRMCRAHTSRGSTVIHSF